MRLRGAGPQCARCGSAVCGVRPHSTVQCAGDHYYLSVMVSVWIENAIFCVLNDEMVFLIWT